jgi:hypothetical protein
MRTPLLVDTSTSFEDYLKRLSKSSRKKYKKALKYAVPWEAVDYDEDIMWRFMEIWSRQTVFGRPVSISMTREKMRSLPLKMFLTENAVHCIEIYGKYAYAHQVRYDKVKDPEIARFMWFKTIEWCCGRVAYLDMDGGSRGKWPDLIRARKNYPNLRYKWSYVPQDVKDNPEGEKPFIVRSCCGWKQLRNLSLLANCIKCGSQL